MVKINRIYTKTGDSGTTALVGGDRVMKDSLRVEAYGLIDELNSTLGMIRTLLEIEKYQDVYNKCMYIQNTLF